MNSQVFFSTTPQKSRLAPDSATALAPLVRLHRGMPVTDSLAIAREFKRLHKNVLATLDSLIADSSISRLDFKPAKYLDTQGKQRRAMELTERGALIAMPFIGGKNSRTGQVRLVDAFMQLRQQTVEKHAETWKGIRQHVAAQKQEITVLKPKAQFQVGIYPVAFLRRSCIGSAS
ncbi:Rha family transcriptional regulator [Candidatus Glomeribacter gigasporarum]|uniref:Rha family transcriptional regulator n=1 Tax=Candidatus Glomeribacter gigasporarum TaxID=132144 RepID=UPI0006789CE7|nr:Rha family transcriptional regulator [Candidatus Glomeribacter gigasporarum]